MKSKVSYILTADFNQKVEVCSQDKFYIHNYHAKSRITAQYFHFTNCQFTRSAVL